MKNYGIYITGNLIRFAGADIEEQEINIASLLTEEKVDAIKKLLKQNRITPERLTLVIPRTQASVRHINLPSVDDKEINQMIEHQLNKLFPYKLGELIFDYALIRKNPDGHADIMLVAVQKEPVLRQLSMLKEAGLTPDTIELSSIFLFNQFCERKTIPASYLLVNFDDSFIDIIHINEGRFAFSQGVNFKGVLEKEEFLKNLNLTTAILRDKGNKIDEIILSGRGVDLKGFLHGLLEGSLPCKVRIDDTLNVMKGLILREKADTLKMNLLPAEFITQKKKKKSEKSLLYFIALLFLNISLIANIVFLQIKSRDEYLYLLKSEVEKADTQSAALQKIMLKLETFRDYQNLSRLTLGLLSDLYRLAPEGVYYNSLSILNRKPQRATMVIIGEAKDSETVLKFSDVLKGSTFINNTDINYITKKDSQGKVEFKISTSL